MRIAGTKGELTMQPKYTRESMDRDVLFRHSEALWEESDKYRRLTKTRLLQPSVLGLELRKE